MLLTTPSAVLVVRLTVCPYWNKPSLSPREQLYTSMCQVSWATPSVAVSDAEADADLPLTGFPMSLNAGTFADIFVLMLFSRSEDL